MIKRRREPFNGGRGVVDRYGDGDIVAWAALPLLSSHIGHQGGKKHHVVAKLQIPGCPWLARAVALGRGGGVGRCATGDSCREQMGVGRRKTTEGHARRRAIFYRRAHQTRRHRSCRRRPPANFTGKRVRPKKINEVDFQSWPPWPSTQGFFSYAPERGSALCYIVLDGRRLRRYLGCYWLGPFESTPAAHGPPSPKGAAGPAFIAISTRRACAPEVVPPSSPGRTHHSIRLGLNFTRRFERDPGSYGRIPLPPMDSLSERCGRRSGGARFHWANGLSAPARTLNLALAKFGQSVAPARAVVRSLFLRFSSAGRGRSVGPPWIASTTISFKPPKDARTGLSHCHWTLPTQGRQEFHSRRQNRARPIVRFPLLAPGRTGPCDRIMRRKKGWIGESIRARSFTARHGLGTRLSRAEGGSVNQIKDGLAEGGTKDCRLPDRDVFPSGTLLDQGKRRRLFARQDGGLASPPYSASSITTSAAN